MIRVHVTARGIEDKNIFEEIRLLLNLQHEDKFLLTLLLLGQPELKDKVESIKQLNQRIAMRFHLESLTKDEIVNYISHRLSVVGVSKDRQIFMPDAITVIYERSGGIPRRINHICDMSLLTGYGKESKNITSDIVKETIQSLSL